MVAVMRPQEIEDEEHEQILQQVAAVDAAEGIEKVTLGWRPRSS
jgi:hypothetical protein